MNHVYNILLSMILVIGFLETSYSQNQSHLLDLRSCGKSCSSNNYSILAVYLSDINGNPVTNSLLTCTPGVEQTTYLSFRYQTSANSPVNNARIFADLNVGEEAQFLNYYFGIIEPATSVPKILTLRNFPLNWTCGQEVRLSNPLLSWTTNASSDLSQNYACNDYPSAQCQFQSNIIVDAPLAVQFDYSFECPINGATEVSFTSTTNGGRAPYQYNWTFTDASLQNANKSDPNLEYYGEGAATLLVTDANGTTNTFNVQMNIPIAFEYSPEVTHQTNPDMPDGSITLQMNEADNLSFSWLGSNGFVSDEKDIYGLSEGSYQVSITDLFGCTETIVFEIDYYIILPLLNDDLKATLQKKSEEVTLSWSSSENIKAGHFEVEKALHDISTFQRVGKLPIIEDTNAYYGFTDKRLPKFQSRIYYRIKLVPQVGKPIYSSTIMIEVPSSMVENKWSASPNPFDTNLRLKYLGKPPSSKDLIYIQIFSPTSFYTNQFTTNDYQLDLTNVVKLAPKGLLVIEIRYIDKVEKLKVIKR